jgi:hypothetical protein
MKEKAGLHCLGSRRGNVLPGKDMLDSVKEPDCETFQKTAVVLGGMRVVDDGGAGIYSQIYDSGAGQRDQRFSTPYVMWHALN